MAKKFLSISAALLSALILVFGSVIPAYADEDATERSYKNSSTGYEAVVYDMADLLSDTEEKN